MSKMKLGLTQTKASRTPVNHNEFIPLSGSSELACRCKSSVKWVPRILSPDAAELEAAVVPDLPADADPPEELFGFVPDAAPLQE
jgi:hypothetical protein